MTADREKLLESVYRAAYNYEGKYGSCPQAVLAAIQDHFDEVDDSVIKAAHTLAGGGALCGSGTCGALAGGMIAIGCQFGRERKNFDEKRSAERLKAYFVGRELCKKFTGEFGCFSCAGVQEKKMGRSYNLWDKEDYQNFEAAGGHDDKCTDVVGKAARWTAEILLDEGVPPKGQPAG